jgi:hypothetical protein
MILSDMSTRKRHDTLWLALGFVLQDIPGDSSTADIALQLRLRLDFPARETEMVMRWLKKVAHLVPEAAQTGAVVKAYGHYGRRWVWSPRSAESLKPHRMWPDKQGGLEARLNDAGVVDTTDW